MSATSCLCPFLVCLCFIQRCCGASHHVSAKVPSKNQTKLANGETEVHHRPKRGWIWNQFFVLEEHLGPEAQYVGKVGSRSFNVSLTVVSLSRLLKCATSGPSCSLEVDCRRHCAHVFFLCGNSVPPMIMPTTCFIFCI